MSARSEVVWAPYVVVEDLEFERLYAIAERRRLVVLGQCLSGEHYGDEVERVRLENERVEQLADGAGQWRPLEGERGSGDRQAMVVGSPAQRFQGLDELRAVHGGEGTPRRRGRDVVPPFLRDQVFAALADPERAR